MFYRICKNILKELNEFVGLPKKFGKSSSVSFAGNDLPLVAKRHASRAISLRLIIILASLLSPLATYS